MRVWPVTALSSVKSLAHSATTVFRTATIAPLWQAWADGYSGNGGAGRRGASYVREQARRASGVEATTPDVGLPRISRCELPPR